MAKKNVYLHIGPALPGVPATHATLRASQSLQDVGLTTPKVEQEDMDRAGIEVLRRHKAFGMKRKEVDGSWAEVCRKAFKRAGKGYDVVISQPDFVDADYQQVALALDGLVGLRLHVVITPGLDADDAQLRKLVGDWGKFLKKQGRLHVLAMPPSASADAFVDAVAGLAGRVDRPRAA